MCRISWAPTVMSSSPGNPPCRVFPSKFLILTQGPGPSLRVQRALDHHQRVLPPGHLSPAPEAGLRVQGHAVRGEAGVYHVTSWPLMWPGPRLPPHPDVLGRVCGSRGLLAASLLRHPDPVGAGHQGSSRLDTQPRGEPIILAVFVRLVTIQTLICTGGSPIDSIVFS